MSYDIIGGIKYYNNIINTNNYYNFNINTLIYYIYTRLNIYYIIIIYCYKNFKLDLVNMLTV